MVRGWEDRRRCEIDGCFEGCFDSTVYYNMYSACGAGIDAGRQVCGAGSDQRSSGDLLGQEQGAFHGRSAGEADQGTGIFVHAAGSDTELEYLQINGNVSCRFVRKKAPLCIIQEVSFFLSGNLLMTCEPMSVEENGITRNRNTLANVCSQTGEIWRREKAVIRRKREKR